MRRIENQQLNVEMKVGDCIKVSLQHLAITQYPDSPTVVVHFIMNELFQLRPVLLVQASNVVSVDVAEAGCNHAISPELLQGRIALIRTVARRRCSMNQRSSWCWSGPTSCYATAFRPCGCPSCRRSCSLLHAACSCLYDGAPRISCRSSRCRDRPWKVPQR